MVDPCVTRPHGTVVFSLPLSPLFLLLIFLPPLLSPLRQANPPFNRISRSPSETSRCFPPSSLFLPLAITAVPLIMVGIWAGATFCSFARARTHARTCQNGIVGVSSPGSIFPGWFLFERRDMQSSALPCALAASDRSFAFCYPPLLPLFSMLSSKHDAFLFSFSLSLSLLEERNVYRTPTL